METRGFRVIPVLDVKEGIAVHAVGGLRDHYPPLRSVLHPTCEPVSLAAAFRDRLGLRELYLADLDAIMGKRPNAALYNKLAEFGLHLWIDAGIQDEHDLDILLGLRDASIVAGLETLAGPDALAGILRSIAPERLILSLDLRAGQPVTHPRSNWTAASPEALLEMFHAAGVRRFLLLDLARVGTGRGVGTIALLRRCHQRFPTAEVSLGGGISGAGDLQEAQAEGAAGVLVGSALHDGRLGRRELSRTG